MIDKDNNTTDYNPNNKSINICKPKKPDFSKIFSKQLYKPEEIFSRKPDKTKEMNDEETKKEGLIPLTPELYQRIQNNNNQLPQDIVQQNMENLSLNKDEIICNYCKKAGH